MSDDTTHSHRRRSRKEETTETQAAPTKLNAQPKKKWTS